MSDTERKARNLERKREKLQKLYFRNKNKFKDIYTDVDNRCNELWLKVRDEEF